MREKADPDLVTAGPYAYVRHPIYSGVLLALLGSTLSANVGWLGILIIATCYFIYSAKKEEKNMLRRFPKEYGEYMKKTKMFVPFIF